MARITVEDCIDKFESRFELVLVASNRARKLHSGETPSVEKDNDKPTVIALREIAGGKLSVEESRKNAILRLRKEPDEALDEEENEEVISDDFEKQYKGEVAKTGVAILPSKRIRKVPVQTTFSNEEKEEKKEEEKAPLELTEEIQEEKK